MILRHGDTNSGSGGVGVSRRYPIGIESWRVDVEYPENRDRTDRDWWERLGETRRLRDQRTEGESEAIHLRGSRAECERIIPILSP